MHESIRKFKKRMLRKRALRKLGFCFGKDQSAESPSSLKIDIVIPAIEKDLDTLPYVIDFARLNVLHPISNIYVISPDSEKIKQVCTAKGCIQIHEESFLPFRKSDIDYRVGGVDRAGWMYQQFLKLSANCFCTEENYLVLDSDTLLVRPQVFERRGQYVFNFSDEYNKPYFDVYQRLLGYPPTCPVSLVSHHIIVNKWLLGELKSDLEKRSGLAWYEAVLLAIDRSELSCFSEYETYGHYVLGRMKEGVCLEYWYNHSLSPECIAEVYTYAVKYGKKYKSLSFHSWNTD